MAKPLTISEYGKIYCEKDVSLYEKTALKNSIFIRENAFENLRNFVAENKDADNEVDKSFSVSRKKGRDFITVKNYVGVIETKDGTTIEILPKIYLGNEQADAEIKEVRAVFLKMLRHLKNSPFIGIDEAHLRSTKFPILEVFITTFITELEKLIRKGIQKNYVNVERNENFLKGKLQFTNHINLNLFHPERFFVSFDLFDANIPHNRLIKSTLIHLYKISRSIRNQNKLRAYTFTLDQIPESTNYELDFNKIANVNSRLYKNYNQLIKWAKVFLLNKSFTNFKGSNLNKAILFPMERIFEDYVSYGFKRYCEGYQVSLQEGSNYLVHEHQGNKKFRLKPDIVLRDDHTSHIIDCKWKIIDSSAYKKNYKISQTDMYQLYAYGKKFRKRENQQLFLIYPKQERFMSSLEVFQYENKLPLRVIPFDLSRGLELEIKSLVNRFNSVHILY